MSEDRKDWCAASAEELAEWQNGGAIVLMNAVRVLNKMGRSDQGDRLIMES